MHVQAFDFSLMLDNNIAIKYSSLTGVQVDKNISARRYTF